MQKILGFSARAALLWLAAAIFAVTALAQQPPAKSPFGVPTAPITSPGLAAPSAQPGGVLSRGWAWLLEMQSRLNRDMASAVRQLKSDNPIAAAATLIGVAFAYGVLHAAGPGHGKAVISSYVLANEETVRRGIALSFLAAIFQALSAILFVGVLAILLRQTSIEMRAAEAGVETISWALVALVGAYLLWRQITGLRATTAPARAAPHGDHAHAHGDHAHHHHDHGPSCSCGHSHMPSPQDLQGSSWSWRQGALRRH